MNVGRKKHVRPSPRCMDKFRTDLKEHQVDPKLAQKMEELKKAIITIDPGRDAPRTGIRSAKVQHVCVIIFSCQPRSVRLFNGCALVKKMLQTAMHQSAAEGAGGLPNRICKKKV